MAPASRQPADVLGGEDASAGDDRNRAAGRGGHVGDDPRRQLGERAAREAAATGREPGLLHRDRVRADESPRTGVDRRPREIEDGRAILVGRERGQLQQHRRVRPLAEGLEQPVAMCAGSWRQGAFGLLAFSSMPSTWGARSSTASTASSAAPRPRRSRTAAPSAGLAPGSRPRRSAPGLGSPIEFTIARRRGDRTILGLGFPFLGARVIVPPTTNPNPSRPSASRCPHVLSKPAARPIGFAEPDPAERDLEGRIANGTADPLPRQGK